MVVHHLQPVVGRFLKKVCHASVSGGYANILFRNARAAGAAAAASAGGGSTAVQPRFSGSTAPLPSSTGLNRVKPLCEVPDPNEHVGKDFGTERHIVLEGQAHHIVTAALYTLAAHEHHWDPTAIPAMLPPRQGPNDPVTPPTLINS